jgi:hypothetical protein
MSAGFAERPSADDRFLPPKETNECTLRSTLPRPLHEDPRIHGRRWFLLAMMCLSLVLVVMSVSGS